MSELEALSALLGFEVTAPMVVCTITGSLAAVVTWALRRYERRA